ncbi:MAG: M20/M25/M40 family metallo-hydrolase, partial [Candidatus Latescibacteria bacterium]|nr:M20/M25/M40 family metallo-hydrolase [Candidatus Latescibacterota bacterium]
MPSPDQTIRSYSPEELRMLAAEGKLKGPGVERLARLHPATSQNHTISQLAFEKRFSHVPCWTDPHNLLNTFLDLVKLHSPSQREQSVAKYLIQKLKTIGFEDIEQDPYGNIIAQKPARDTQTVNLMFTAHMDCVYPGGNAPVTPCFHASGEIRTNGANSLGADDKAGITSILAALDYMHKAQLPHGDIRVVFTVQEELGYRGIKQI